MAPENSSAQMRKGVLELCILAALDRAPSYVPDLIVEFQNAGLKVVEGTLYPLLNRLKNAELLTYQWEESRSGPPRKYYRLTERGKSALLESRSSWKELVHSVETLLQPIEN